MCGIIAAYCLEGVDPRIVDRTMDLMHGSRNRGNDGFGFSALLQDGTLERNVAKTLNELKPVLDGYRGRAIAILGHDRYQTSGGNQGDTRNAMQPFQGGEFAFAFNGNIVNDEILGEELKRQGHTLEHEPILDTEVLKHMIQQTISEGVDDLKSVMRNIQNRIDGCCNIALLNSKGEFAASKDKWGFRPVVYGIHQGMLLLASESGALEQAGCRDVQFLGRRKILQIDPATKSITKKNLDIVDLPPRKQGCFFEVVYFARPWTRIWDEVASGYRKRFGQALAEDDIGKFKPEESFVINIPESSEEAARAYAEKLRIPHLRAITISPDFGGRTFTADPDSRIDKVKKKYVFNPDLKPFIQGKKVILPDDSIVRGLSLGHMVKAFREFYGPSEVHLRIPSPAIVAPCFYGISMATIEELIAPKFFKDINAPTEMELLSMAKYFGAESLRYLSTEQLEECMGKHGNSICRACITGQYPTVCGQQKYDELVVQGQG